MTSSLSDIRERVDEILRNFLAEERGKFEGIAPASLPLIEVLEGLLHRGKRIRAALCVWGYELGAALAGPSPAASTPSSVFQAAASLELLHAAALVHDDLMDDSDTRRGLPAAHRWFSARHAGSKMSGDAGRFGLAGALLAGDLCLGWSEQLFGASGMEATERVRQIRDRMRTEVMLGQYLDMLGQMTELPGKEAEENALLVVRYKSAKYTVEHPLLLGAALAGAGEAMLGRLSGYGLPLGEAFQLRDDLLGVFGDPDETGKPAGDDLREGKRTVLVAYALQAADPAQHATIDALLGDPGLDAEGVLTLRGVLSDTGAVDRVERLIASLAETARSALGSVADSSGSEGAGSVLETLDAFTETVINRRS